MDTHCVYTDTTRRYRYKVGTLKLASSRESIQNNFVRMERLSKTVTEKMYFSKMFG